MSPEEGDFSALVHGFRDTNYGRSSLFRDTKLPTARGFVVLSVSTTIEGGLLLWYGIRVRGCKTNMLRIGRWYPLSEDVHIICT